MALKVVAKAMWLIVPVALVLSANNLNCFEQISCILFGCVPPG